MDGIMSKRELSDTEKKICEKMVAKFENEVRHLKFLERYHDLMIGEGLYWNYLERVKESKMEKKKVVDDIQEAILKIVELKRQVMEGVEQKIPTGIN